MWANYESHGIGTCELSANEVISALEKEKNLTLATCTDSRVTIRPMSHISNGLTIYFQTGEYYLKTQQIKANPNVAISVGTYEIEGLAEIIGHPMDESNQFFIKKFRARHQNYAERWSALPNAVVVKVEIRLVRQWRYIDGKPYIATIRFDKRNIKPHIETGSLDVENFVQAVAKQDAATLRTYFAPDAEICWHDSNEQFTVDEYIRANCEYPGKWSGEVQRVEKIEGGMVIITKIFSDESSHLVTAFAKLEDGKISRLDEYYSDCGEAPNWRKTMKIGKPINQNK